MNRLKRPANIQMEPTRLHGCAIMSPWRAAHLARQAPLVAVLTQSELLHAER
jgi:hypothetical protein